MANGSMVNAMLVGDENGHWYVDEQGNAMLKDAKGHLCYLSQKQLEHLIARRNVRLKKNNDRRRERLNKSKQSGTKSPFVNPYVGEKKGLVILVDFPDVWFRVGSTNNEVVDYYDLNFNGKLRSEYRLEGSVRDYFYDQSYGQFDVTFDIVGPIRLSHNLSYYGENDEVGDDLHPCEMVIEAIHKAKDAGVDFSQYDWNGDGEIEQVVLVYSGTGENSSGRDDDIWPHEWDLDSGKEYNDGTGAQDMNGYIVNTYSVTSELASGIRPSGIGVACHEFSHSLGLPDLYDVSYSGCPNMQKYDVMAHGCYNGRNDDSTLPVAFSAWERWTIGWMTPIVLEEPCEITNMPVLSDQPVAYVIYNDAHPDEYFMLENRQPVGWDTYMTRRQVAHGLMITHVDYDEQAWFDNEVNCDKNHPRLMFVPADNSYGSYGNQSDAQMAGDMFPGSKNVNEFSDNSLPAASLYNKNNDGTFLLHKSLTNITETDGLISFLFNEGSTGIENVSENGVPHDVYSLQGINMGRQTNKLSQGIYIVNGRKVIVGKTME